MPRHARPAGPNLREAPELYKVIHVAKHGGENADVAQLVAHNLAKVGVASSNLVIRSGGRE